MNKQRIIQGISIYLLYLTSLWAGNYEAELESLSDSLGKEVGKTEISTIAVLPLRSMDNQTTKLGKFLAEELSINLVMKHSELTLVDRVHLEQVMQEHKLTAEGLIRPENAKKLNMAGIEGVVLGSVIPFGENYRVNLKVIATDTAKYVAATRGTLTSNPSLDQMAGIVRGGSSPDSVVQTGRGLISEPVANTIQLGSIQAKVSSIRAIPKRGEVIAHVVLKNTSNTALEDIRIVTSYRQDILGYDNHGNAYYLKATTGISGGGSQSLSLTAGQSTATTFTFQYGQRPKRRITYSYSDNAEDALQTWHPQQTPQTFSFSCSVNVGRDQQSLSIVDHPVK